MKNFFPKKTALIGLVMAISCDFSSIELEKVKAPTLDNSFAINLGNIIYTVDDLVNDLEDESIEAVTDDDLFITFVQRDTSFYNNIDEFIRLNSDITNAETYSPFSADVPAQPTENTIVIPTRTFDFEFNSEGGEQIDSTFFKGGTLAYTFSSEFGMEVDYVLTLNDIRNASNEPIIFTNTLTNTEASKAESVPLDGLKNIAERVGSSNIFNVSLDLTFTVPAGVSVNSAQEVSLELVFQNSEFSAVFGDFGMDPVNVKNDAISFSIFDEFGDGGLFLRNPSVTLDFENKFGVEFGVSLGGVKSINGTGAQTVLTGEVVDNLQFIDAPNSSQIGQARTSSFDIDINNSNIDDLLNSTPSEIVFDISAIPNAEGSDNVNNFLLDSSFIEIRTTIEIPLDVRMDGFSRDFNLKVPGSELEDADSIVLNLRILNEIPFDGTLDLSFRDSNGEEIYTLNSIGIIESPSVGSDGRTTATTERLSSIRLEQEGIDAFLQTSEIVATINIFTFENAEETFVKIFSDYQLEIYLTAQGRISIGL